jgi:hypothetical protein
MYHHDSRSYPVAASAAAAKARVKMEETIQKGLASAQATLEQVQSQVPRDRIVASQVLDVAPYGNDGYQLVLPGVEPYRLHEHALGQLCERTGIPGRYVRELSSEGAWAQKLVSHNFCELLHHQRGRNLVRIVDTAETDPIHGTPRDPEVRGFLSDRFRRLDSRPLLEAFVSACQDMGLVPIEGFALDTKVRMRAVLPQVFEPMPNEVMLFGLQWGNSDFGDGGHCVSLWNQRVWCTNTAVMDEVLRQVHLGGRIPDDVRLSQRTMELDSQTNASALQDVVREFIGPERVTGYLSRIREAVEERVDEKDVTRLLKKDLTEAELKRATDVFASADEINVPAGRTVYRLSNAVSWIAQAQGVSRQRQLELQDVAGKLMGNLVESRAARKV